MTVIDLEKHRKAKHIEKLEDNLRKAVRMKALYQKIKENKATPGQIKFYQQLREYFITAYPHIKPPKNDRPSKAEVIAHKEKPQ